MWWKKFTEQWNGISLIPRSESPSRIIETDASGSWGCGGHWEGKWFQWKWTDPAQESSIAQKELLPILLAMVIWGRQWEGQVVECRCDNMAVVQVVNSGQAHDKTLMHLLRCLFFIAAHFDVHVRAAHLPGVQNVAADALSHDDLSRFWQASPEADPQPTSIPTQLTELLVRDWMSPRWTQLFSDCCSRFSSKYNWLKLAIG